jgi:hypothetical protein
MKLLRLSRETVFGYEESVITATRSDGIACLPSDQANGRPAVGGSLAKRALRLATVTGRATFTDFEHKIRKECHSVPEHKT